MFNRGLPCFTITVFFQLFLNNYSKIHFSADQHLSGDYSETYLGGEGIFPLFLDKFSLSEAQYTQSIFFFLSTKEGLIGATGYKLLTIK